MYTVTQLTVHSLQDMIPISITELVQFLYYLCNSLNSGGPVFNLVSVSLLVYILILLTYNPDRSGLIIASRGLWYTVGAVANNDGLPVHWSRLGRNCVFMAGLSVRCDNIFHFSRPRWIDILGVLLVWCLYLGSLQKGTVNDGVERYRLHCVPNKLCLATNRCDSDLLYQFAILLTTLSCR